jgi:hypothetical protein
VGPRVPGAGDARRLEGSKCVVILRLHFKESVVMSKTGRRTWQQAEERAAALFACRRQPGSGSSGRDDVSSMSDSTHTVLYLESKLRVLAERRVLHG